MMSDSLRACMTTLLYSACIKALISHKELSKGDNNGQESLKLPFRLQGWKGRTPPRGTSQEFLPGLYGKHLKEKDRKKGNRTHGEIGLLYPYSYLLALATEVKLLVKGTKTR